MATDPWGRPITAAGIMQSPAFLNMLMEIGAGMDPEGAGGIIGRAGQNYLATRARTAYGQSAQDSRTRGVAETRGAQQGAQDDAELMRLRKFVGGLVDELGGYSPLEMPGVTSAKITPNKTVQLDITPPPEGENKPQLGESPLQPGTLGANEGSADQPMQMPGVDVTAEPDTPPPLLLDGGTYRDQPQANQLTGGQQTLTSTQQRPAQQNSMIAGGVSPNVGRRQIAPNVRRGLSLEDLFPFS